MNGIISPDEIKKRYSVLTPSFGGSSVADSSAQLIQPIINPEEIKQRYSQPASTKTDFLGNLIKSVKSVKPKQVWNTYEQFLKGGTEVLPLPSPEKVGGFIREKILGKPPIQFEPEKLPETTPEKIAYGAGSAISQVGQFVLAGKIADAVLGVIGKGIAYAKAPKAVAEVVRAGEKAGAWKITAKAAPYLRGAVQWGISALPKLEAPTVPGKIRELATSMVTGGAFGAISQLPGVKPVTKYLADIISPFVIKATLGGKPEEAKEDAKFYALMGLPFLMGGIKITKGQRALVPVGEAPIAPSVNLPAEIGREGVGAVTKPVTTTITKIAPELEVLFGKPEASAVPEKIISPEEIKKLTVTVGEKETFNIVSARENIQKLIQRTDLNKFIKETPISKNIFAYVEDLGTNVAERFNAPSKTVISSERINHIKENRPVYFDEIVNLLPSGIKNPDNVFPNPNRPESFILVKKGTKDFGIVAQVDRIGEYNFLRTVEKIPEHTLKKLEQFGKTAQLPTIPGESQILRPSGQNLPLQTVSEEIIAQESKLTQELQDFLDGKIKDVMNVPVMEKEPTTEEIKTMVKPLIGGVGGITQPKGVGGEKAIEPTPEELEEYERQAMEEVKGEMKAEEISLPYAGEIKKFKNFLKFAGEKKATKTKELFREHIPRSVFGVSSDEVASALGKTENEFMNELTKDITMIEQNKATPQVISRFVSNTKKARELKIRLPKRLHDFYNSLPADYYDLIRTHGELGQVVGVSAKPTAETIEKIGGREQKAIAKSAEMQFKDWEDSYKSENMTSAQLMREAEKSIKEATNKGVKDRLAKETSRVILQELRTPEYVLEKMGLKEKVYQPLKEGQEKVATELKIHVLKANDWWKRIGNNSKERKLASKNIFKYLDGEQINLNNKEKEVANEIRNYLVDWADRLDLPEDRRIADYITHIFEPDFIATKFTFPDEIARILDFITPNKIYNPFLEKRLGAKGYKQDVFEALDAYVYRGSRKLYLDKPLNHIATLVDALPLQAADYVDKLVKNFQGRPDAFEKWIDINIIQGLPPKIKQIVGARPGKKLVGLIQQQIFRSTLGLNIGSAIKNMTQGVNTFAELGTKYTSLGYLQLAQKGTKELQETGAMKDIIIAEAKRSSISSTLEKIDKGLFYLFELAEKINRGSAYYGAKQKYLDKGFSEKEAIEKAKGIVRKTQFAYGKLDTPLLLQSPLGRLGFTLATYPLKQFEFLGGMTIKKEWSKIARYIISSLILVVTIGDYLGLDTKDVFTKNILPGLGIIPSTTLKIVGPEWEREKAVKNLIRMLFVPAGGQIKKIIPILEGESRTEPSKTYPKGQRRFKIEEPSEVIRALLGGEWNTKAADEYLIKKGLKKDSVRKLLWIITGDKQYK